MSKAILIIDMPENCKRCSYKYDCYMFHEGDKRPQDCPLRPLPRLEHNDDVDRMMAKHSAFIHFTLNKHAMMRFIDGWESALDEIEGKSR